jgi:hypothetical protein
MTGESMSEVKTRSREVLRAAVESNMLLRLVS